jgi:hypothetical protein
MYSVDVNMGIDVFQAASNSWDEGTITWNNAPGTSGGSLDFVNVTTGWTDFDVTSLVTGDGTYSFVLKGDANNGSRDFSSTEGPAANVPVLRVTHQ